MFLAGPLRRLEAEKARLSLRSDLNRQLLVLELYGLKAEARHLVGGLRSAVSLLSGIVAAWRRPQRD